MVNCIPACFFLPTGGCNCDTGFTKFLFGMVACACVVIPVFVTGVTLLGWSSFEVDTIQGNGECIFPNL